jgi:Spy/CpxP family protein refolding chaperone
LTASLFKNSEPAIDERTYDRYKANHMKNRYSFHVLTIGTMLIVALTAPAQQTATGPVGADQDQQVQDAAQSRGTNVGPQMKLLTERLDLTRDQQARLKPILKEFHEAAQKLMQDESLSREERLAKVRPQRYKADKQIREILTDDQKRKLDQYLQGPHPKMHGNLSGTTPPAP